MLQIAKLPHGVFAAFADGKMLALAVRVCPLKCAEVGYRNLRSMQRKARESDHNVGGYAYRHRPQIVREMSRVTDTPNHSAEWFFLYDHASHRINSNARIQLQNPRL